jgi:Zn-dependent membrane protease YugP
MHPVVVLVPIVALTFGARIWVRDVLKQHDSLDRSLPGTASELARIFLDGRQLSTVQVEITDVGDHYDPETRTVRLNRARFHRHSLTAVAIAAHEVGHAVQHASGYGPFLWRIHLVKVARVAGEVGTTLLLALPVAAWFSRTTIPAGLLGPIALAILGSGMMVQLVTLPTEIDASFGHALPMLSSDCVSGEKVDSARRILTACSLTYIGTSMVSVIQILPWLGRPTVGSRLGALFQEDMHRQQACLPGVPRIRLQSKSVRCQRGSEGGLERWVRAVATPLARTYCQLFGCR